MKIKISSMFYKLDSFVKCYQMLFKIRPVAVQKCATKTLKNSLISENLQFWAPKQKVSISKFSLMKSYKFMLRRAFLFQLCYRYSYHYSSLFMFSQCSAWFGKKISSVFSYFSFSILFHNKFSIIFHTNSNLKTFI